jgi:hypothetical protein
MPTRCKAATGKHNSDGTETTTQGVDTISNVCKLIGILAACSDDLFFGRQCHWNAFTVKTDALRALIATSRRHVARRWMSSSPKPKQHEQEMEVK